MSDYCESMRRAIEYDRILSIYRRSFDPLKFTRITVWMVIFGGSISIKEVLLALWAIAMAAVSIVAAALHVIRKFK